MNGTTWAILAVALLASAALNELKKRTKTKGAIFKKSPLTKREQPMFFRLREAFPEHVVLAQVSFSALLDTKHFATRGTFKQKVADFVLCDRGFNVIAIIELDDRSHNGREAADEARAKLLINAGHRVLRYRQIPDTARVRADIAS